MTGPSARIVTIKRESLIARPSPAPQVYPYFYLLLFIRYITKTKITIWFVSGRDGNALFVGSCCHRKEVTMNISTFIIKHGHSLVITVNMRLVSLLVKTVKNSIVISASQMTLRRHVLRNHTSRDDWHYKVSFLLPLITLQLAFFYKVGFQCPYCGETYMEPASYQQHVRWVGNIK